MMRPTVTMVGRVGADPMLKFTQKGDAWCTFRIAHTARVKNGDEWKDGQTTWVGVSAWRTLAENVAESITKGTSVIVSGRLEQRDWETQDGERRTSYEIVADEVGLALSFASASVTRNSAGTRQQDQPWSDKGTQAPASGREDVF